MRTINFIKKSKYIVLLIGASRYNTKKYSDIPNVETNIRLMKEMFMDPRYIGVNERNIIVSLNEDSKTIARRITDAKEMAKNSDYTLFVYYSGHGIINPDNYKLYFATSDMDVNYLDSDAIEAKSVLEKISRSAASRKILVVDACHSGGIHNAMGDAPETALMKNFEGVHYVSACDEDSTALFPKDAPDAPTYFTGALIDRIHNGMDTDRAYITLREVVDDIAYDFKYRQNLPVPQQSSVLNADQMPFALNVNANNSAASSAAPAPERKSAVRRHNAKITRVGFATVFAAALTFFVFKSANHGDNRANDMEIPVVSVVENNGDVAADSLFNRYVYMASRYLEGGDFDPEDFKDCIAKAEAIKSGDAKVHELNRRFEATYRGRE
ncbi:MAG: caspase family protein [Bacteroidales bacterium]|nr:caspase family protein [Bacteroidales bacterium]